MRRYKAILFAPDGDWVVDFSADTKEEVIERLADKGSRWIFYPFEGIILDKGGLTTSKQRLVDVAPNLPSDWKGKCIKTVKRLLGKMTDEELYEMATGG